MSTVWGRLWKKKNNQLKWLVKTNNSSTMRFRICGSGVPIEHNSVRALVRENACLPFFYCQHFFCVSLVCVVSEVMRSQGNLAFTYGGAGGRPNTLWINCWRGCSKAGIKIHSHIMSIFWGEWFSIWCPLKQYETLYNPIFLLYRPFS